MSKRKLTRAEEVCLEVAAYLDSQIEMTRTLRIELSERLLAVVPQGASR